MREKASKDRFLEPEEKGKEKKKDRGEGNKEKKKKAMVALLVFTIKLNKKTAGRKRFIWR